MKEEAKKLVNYLESKREEIDYNYPDDYLVSSDLILLLDYIKQLETNIKDSVERHKETIQDTKDFYRPLEDRIYSGSTLIDLAEIHIEILERGIQ